MKVKISDFMIVACKTEINKKCDFYTTVKVWLFSRVSFMYDYKLGFCYIRHENPSISQIGVCKKGQYYFTQNSNTLMK